MSISKDLKDKKSTLGQFMTPYTLSKKIINHIKFDKDSVILEPSFGDGSFIICIIDKLISDGFSFDVIMEKMLYGIEIDDTLYNKTLNRVKDKYGYIPKSHNLINGDFFVVNFNTTFSHIIGNPPFGGKIDYKYQDELDKMYGKRYGEKIKKETYSFFSIKSVELLKPNGHLCFICSDTFLTIKTMYGLRNYFLNEGYTEIEKLSKFSEETNYPMVIIDFYKDKKVDYIKINNEIIPFNLIKNTPNLSWGINEKYNKYFKGTLLKDYIISSGGLTTGKNEYFVRDIKSDESGDYIIENYDFQYYQDPITLKKELDKSKLNKMNESKKIDILKKENMGCTVENVKISQKTKSEKIYLPNKDYLYYNKSSNEKVYDKPRKTIYWKDDGKAVTTFKKNGKWFLSGFGGKDFYNKECITWQLISSQINPRYLPTGYILDNSSPVLVLKENVDKNELYFILGWLLCDISTEILKTIINHTKNIQGKDIERLPYPIWCSDENKKIVISIVKTSVENKRNGENINIKDLIKTLNKLFI